MKIIDGITYEYLNKLYWQNNQQLYNQKCIALDNLFSLQKQQYIDNISQIIYQEICNLIPKQYKVLIYQQNFINSPIFNLYADHLLADIMFQWSIKGAWNKAKNLGKKAAKKIADTGKKGLQIAQKHAKRVVQKGKKIASAVGSSVKNFATSSIKAIKSAASAGWNKLKQIGSAIWQGLKKLGDVVFGWIKAAWNFIKDGFKLFANLVTGGHCGLSKPQDALKQTEQLTGNCTKSFGFMEGSIKGAQKTGNQQIESAKQLDKILAKGGNADQALKKHTESLGNKVKAVSQSDLSSNGKQAAAAQGKKLQQSIPEENKKYLKDIQKNTKPSEILSDKKSEDKLLYQSDFQTRIKYASKLLKDDIIRLVYKGLTPKVLFQQYYGQSFSKYQGDIIIAQSKLSFKTTNRCLICEQTNLQTKQQIIYESDIPFKGKHLIFETTQNKFVQHNNIITQQDAAEYKQIIMQEIPWIAITMWAGTILGVVGLLMALTYLICSCVAGIGVAAAPVVDSAGKPAQTTTGAAAAQPSLAAKIAGVTGKMTGGKVGAVMTLGSGLDTLKGAKQTYDATLGDGLDVGLSQQELSEISSIDTEADPPC